MPHKVRLKHPHASSPLGLKNGKAVPLDEATAFGTFLEAQRAMNSWLDYAGRERRASWSGQVVNSEGTPC